MEKILKQKILVIGANGQLGVELTTALAKKYGADNVIAADIRLPVIGLLVTRPPAKNLSVANTIVSQTEVQHTVLDVLDATALRQLVADHNITQVYQLAAMLSATGEQFPLKAWDLNMQGLINVLELARDSSIQQVFWPSSIAAFGPNTPRENTPQTTVMDPSTMYGISKLAGERLCEYYHSKYGIDVRSIRYPGVISYASPPGGGTTDYAIEIFRAAKRGETYTCFLEKDTTLPMIYMPDAIRATIELMSADRAKLKVWSSYNVAALSFSPTELACEIQKAMPNFEVQYQPDFRQEIAQSWPCSINDSDAQAQWGWQPSYGIAALTKDMLENMAS